eukprot:187594_1
MEPKTDNSCKSGYERDKLITFGYIRNFQASLPYIIPTSVYKVFFEFYHTLSFNKLMYHDGLQFVGDTIVRKNTNRFGYVTCFFGEELSNKICSQFNIYIKWTIATDFFMGYIFVNPTEYMHTNSTSSGLGQRNTNSKCSVGIRVHKKDKKLWIYDSDSPLGRASRNVLNDSASWESNSIFMLSFDFKRNKLAVNYQQNEIYSMSLKHCKRLTPTIALYDKEQIEILKYQYVE